MTLRQIIFCLIFATLVHGYSSYAVDMQVLPEFDGYHKDGRWLPLRVMLSGDNGKISGEVLVEEIQDGAAEAKKIYSTPVNIFGDISITKYLYVYPESFRRNMNVILVDNNDREITRSEVRLSAIQPEDILILVMGATSGGLSYLSEQEGEDNLSHNIHVSYVNPYSQTTNISLPHKWKGYDSVDVMVIGDISAGAFSGDQKRALSDWVYSGGRLIVSGGAYSQRLIGTFVEELLPVKIKGTRILSSITSLSREFGWYVNNGNIVVASSELVSGGKVILAEGDGLPVIAEKQFGDGNVIFMAFDYLDPAFRAWGGKKNVWETLIPKTSPDKRMAKAADFPFKAGPSTLPSYKFVGFFLIMYILCFGPLNYLLLKRIDKSHWTWLTMPAIAIIFTGGLLGFTYATKSQVLTINDISVADIYRDINRVKVKSYFSFFPHTASEYSIKFPRTDAVFVNRIQWDNKKTQQDIDCKFLQGDIFSMEIASKETQSLQLFYGESFTDLATEISMDLDKSSDGIIQGKIMGNLPFDLTDCYVFSDGNYSYIGALKADANIQIKIDETRSGDIHALYSNRTGEKRRFINFMLKNPSFHLSGDGIIGWMDESALKELVKMEINEGYKALGMSLIIIHL
jgi:hypothetical protein